MWPRLGASKLVSRWMIAMLVVSVLALVDRGWTFHWLAFVPSRVWHGEVWRLVTWIFVEPAPMSLIFAIASIYKFGGELAPRWGERRLRRYTLELLIGSAALATVLAVLSDSARHGYSTGGWAVGDILVIAWARQYPNAELVVYRLITVRGQQLVMLTCGITLLFSIGGGVLHWAPELLACAGAALYPASRLQRI